VVPSYVLGTSLVGSIQELRRQLNAGTLEIPQPPAGVGNVPLVGERILEAWTLASTNLEQAMVQLEPQIMAFGRWALGFLVSIGGTILTTVLSLIIAGVLLTYAGPATKAIRAVTDQLKGEWDEDLVAMASITISSVAKGVLGVALIQSLLCALGMLVAGVPAAGILTVVVLFLAIVQLPPILIMILPIIWAWGNLGTVWALVFTVYSILASASDTPLKAVFLSRGNLVPMPVVLLGAIGGMVWLGMMGLFLGAVVLSVGYQLLRLWVGEGRAREVSELEPAGA
jgi:predicted PurR-regulated permease PerM